MLRGKERSYLKSIANNIDPIFQIGKGGLNKNFIVQLDKALEKRELVKVKILENCDLGPKETAIEICEAIGAEFVQAIGSKFVIYKESKNNKQIDLSKI